MSSRIKKKRKLTWIDGVVIAILCLVLLCVIVVISRHVQSRSLRVVEAEYQSYTSSTPAEALVIRGEHLISAPTAGYFKPYVEEGSKVAAGSAIGAMSNDPDGEGSTQVYSGAYSGTVSFQMDGWEEILNAEAMDSTDRSALIRLYQEGSVQANSENSIDSTASGRTVAKIVDNFQGCHVLLWLDQPPHQFVNDGCAVFTYDTEDGASSPIKAQVEENGMLDDGRYYLMLNVSATVTEMVELRHLDCTLQGETISGVLLPAESVVIDGSGQAGVWTVRDNMLEYCPINISGRYEGNYLTDDIEEHTLIVTVPAKAREGMKYYG
ncbi:MAG: hypothetical protein IJI40_07920 [Firmicutes bacterium]|nr:hypothetical protein [Bacillota bacterium]